MQHISNYIVIKESKVCARRHSDYSLETFTRHIWDNTREALGEIALYRNIAV